MLAAWILVIVGAAILCFSLYKLINISYYARQQHINNNVSRTQSIIMWYVYMALAACILIAVSGVFLVSLPNA